jgi:ankyrin repeat protein
VQKGHVWILTWQQSIFSLISLQLLHKACHMALAPVVRLLLLHGANVRCSDESGKTPLHDLCWMGSLYPDGSEEIATMLLSQVRSINEWLLLHVHVVQCYR